MFATKNRVPWVEKMFLRVCNEFPDMDTPAAADLADTFARAIGELPWCHLRAEETWVFEDIAELVARPEGRAA